MSKTFYKYFMFSATDAKRRQEINKTIGMKYEPGTVLSGGVYRQFTEIVNDPKESHFSDAIIVASGDIRDMRYKR